MLFFTSDEHYGNPAVIGIEDRPFLNENEYEEHMVSMTNACMKETDEAYHIGDFIGFTKNDPESLSSWEASLSIVKKMVGTHHLVMGNNEMRLVRDVFNEDYVSFASHCVSLGFASVSYDVHEFVKGRRMHMNHFPSNAEAGVVNLFGHVHRATGIWKPFGINVGVDVHHYKLLSEEALFRLLERKERWWDADPDVVSLFPQSPYETFGKFPDL